MLQTFEWSSLPELCVLCSCPDTNIRRWSWCFSGNKLGRFFWPCLSPADGDQALWVFSKFVLPSDKWEVCHLMLLTVHICSWLLCKIHPLTLQLPVTGLGHSQWYLKLTILSSLQLFVFFVCDGGCSRVTLLTWLSLTGWRCISVQSPIEHGSRRLW